MIFNLKYSNTVLCVQEVVTHFIQQVTIWIGSLLIGHTVHCEIVYSLVKYYAAFFKATFISQKGCAVD